MKRVNSQGRTALDVATEDGKDKARVCLGALVRRPPCYAPTSAIAQANTTEHTHTEHKLNTQNLAWHNSSMHH
eukprot:COSAG05_NODE_893_length_6708_cov_2.153427_3_plen_73_part_00